MLCCFAIKQLIFLSVVIEVSCGEYGDNVRKLVAAIKNGKHDIQLGKPFPEIELETLNNANVKVNNTEVEEKKVNGLESNGVNNMLLACAANDIAKDSAACEFSLDCSVCEYVKGTLGCRYHSPFCYLTQGNINTCNVGGWSKTHLGATLGKCGKY